MTYQDRTFEENFAEYCSVIARAYPLLEPYQERALFRKVEAGKDAKRKLADAAEGTCELGAAERKRLARKAAMGREAQDALVMHNQRLVFGLASRYHKQYGAAHNVDVVDIVGAGNVALVEAVRQYDPGKGARLATFAWHKVKGAILKFLDQGGRFIALPSGASAKASAIGKAIGRLNADGCDNPGVAAIARAAGLSEDAVADLMPRIARPASLDAPVSEDGATLVETVPGAADDDLERIVGMDGADTAPEKPLLSPDEREAMLAALTDREREALLLRFAPGRGAQNGLRPFQDVGKQMGISRQRAEQLFKKGWAKLVARKAVLGFEQHAKSA